MGFPVARMAGSYGSTWRQLPAAVDDAALAQIVGSQLDGDTVAGQDANVVLTHLAGDVRSHDVTVLQPDAKRRVGERLDHDAFHLQCFFLRQAPGVSV